MMSSPAFGKENIINCSHLEGRAPSPFISDTIILPQNFRLWILSDIPWGFTYCANHKGGYFIVPICIEAASWISLFSQNPVIELFYLLTINQKEEFFFIVV